ncbi:9726_t:CDS:2, partial [Acaulospora morrowiae]
ALWTIANVPPYLLGVIYDLTELDYLIRVKSLSSRSLLINYLDNYPLLSSKYLDYLDWRIAHGLGRTGPRDHYSTPSHSLEANYPQPGVAGSPRRDTFRQPVAALWAELLN